MRLEINNQVIPVRACFLVVDDPNAKVIYLDCKAKRPAAQPFTSFGDEAPPRLEVWLTADADTLCSDPISTSPTVVTISGLPPGDWFLEVSVAKYSIYLFLWNGARLINPPLVTLWSSR